MRAVLAEDLFLLRDGLVRLLEAHDFEIAAAVEDAPGLLRALIEHRPDVAIVDVRLPPSFTDDGCGGADPARGGGLAGIERRLGSFDGILAVSSPPGGPTMIVMEVPVKLIAIATSRHE